MAYLIITMFFIIIEYVKSINPKGLQTNWLFLAIVYSIVMCTIIYLVARYVFFVPEYYEKIDEAYREDLSPIDYDIPNKRKNKYLCYLKIDSFGNAYVQVDGASLKLIRDTFDICSYENEPYIETYIGDTYKLKEPRLKLWFLLNNRFKQTSDPLTNYESRTKIFINTKNIYYE